MKVKPRPQQADQSMWWTVIMIRAIADLKSSHCLLFGLLIDINISATYLNIANLLLLLTLRQRKFSHCQDMLKPDAWHVARFYFFNREP